MTLAGRLAEQTGAPVLLCYAERLPRGRGYRFTLEPCPRRCAASRRRARSTAPRGADPPLPGAVPVELQPLQGAGGRDRRPAAGCASECRADAPRRWASSGCCTCCRCRCWRPIGIGAGAAALRLGRERRRVCLINLARCFPQLPERERVALAQGAFPGLRPHLSRARDPLVGARASASCAWCASTAWSISGRSRASR